MISLSSNDSTCEMVEKYLDRFSDKGGHTLDDLVQGVESLYGEQLDMESIQSALNSLEGEGKVDVEEVDGQETYRFISSSNENSYTGIVRPFSNSW